MHENMHENHIIQVPTHMNQTYIPYIKSSTIRSIHIQTYTVPFLFLRPGRVYRSFVRALNLVGAGPDSDVLRATVDAVILTQGGETGGVREGNICGCVQQRFI